MLLMIWHWITGEIFGWGGVGALISAGAWALWFFCPTLPGVGTVLPYKQQFLRIAIAATVFTVTQAYFFTNGYLKGEADCHAQWDAANVQAAKDKKALEDAAAAQAAKDRAAADSRLGEMADKLQQQVDENAKQIATRKGGDCPLTQSDIDGLRSIR